MDTLKMELLHSIILMSNFMMMRVMKQMLIEENRHVGCRCVDDFLWLDQADQKYAIFLGIHSEKYRDQQDQWATCADQELQSLVWVGPRKRITLAVLPDGRFHGHFAVFCPRNFSNVRGLAVFEKYHGQCSKLSEFRNLIIFDKL